MLCIVPTYTIHTQNVILTYDYIKKYTNKDIFVIKF